MSYLHPLLGACAVLLTAFVATRGLVARQGGKPATAARRLHRRLGPWALGLMWASAILGTTSTLVLRPDLTLGETWHLAVGWAGVALMTVAALLTRQFTREPRLRSVHPWIGVVALLAALLQALTGIELLP